jgi:hypothetical protein
LKKELSALAVFCLLIVAVIGPVTGSAGGNPAGDVSVITTRPESATSPGDLLTPPSIVKQGNKITISGTAKGNPGPGVGIWIIGVPACVPGSCRGGYTNQFVVQPDSTGFYSLDLDTATTNMEKGNYHVIVQHPGKNEVLDIYLVTNTAGGSTDGWVYNKMLTGNNDAHGTRIVKILGAGSLQRDNAFDALVQGFRESGVDDIIATASFSIVTTPTVMTKSTPNVTSTPGVTSKPSVTSTLTGSHNTSPVQ